MRGTLSALIVGCLLSACNDSRPPQSQEVTRQQDRSALLRQQGQKVLSALHDTNFQALTVNIQPHGGLRFSPYGHIDLFSDQKLNSQNLLRAADARTRLSWGSYPDGSATIVLSPQDYLRQFVYTADFLNADSTAIIQGIPHDDKEQSIGNLYDGADCITYIKKGEGGQHRLRLFFAPEGDQYYLLGLMHEVAPL